MLEYLQSGVPLVLLVLVEVIVAVAGIWAISLIKKLITKTGIEVDEKTMEDIKSLISTAVGAINQKFTDTYKAASDNGKLTDEQKSELFERTKNIVMSGLNNTQLQALAEKYGMDSEEAVDMLIEDTVQWKHSYTKHEC